MHNISKVLFRERFKRKYAEAKGAEFEDWFSELAGHAFGTDFEDVSAHGNQGDWKCDGRLVKSGTIFQCYAPDTFDNYKTISKINKDFSGAQLKWPKFMNVWVFVYNNKGGVPVTIIAHIDKLRNDNPDIDIDIWARPKLYKLFMMMSHDEKCLMFGDVPDQTTVKNLTLADLEPVIDVLQKREPDPNDPLPPPPSARKLEKNALSKDSVAMLRTGGRKVKLVEKYFTKVASAELGEKIAESFRKRYAELKGLGLDAEDIFGYLHEFTGLYRDAKKQVAVLAVMAYFFETCDIFENPAEEDTLI